MHGDDRVRQRDYNYGWSLLQHDQRGWGRVRQGTVMGIIMLQIHTDEACKMDYKSVFVCMCVSLVKLSLNQELGLRISRGNILDITSNRPDVENTLAIPVSETIVVCFCFSIHVFICRAVGTKVKMGR